MWSQGEVDAMYDAAYARLTQNDWAGAALAAVDAAAGGGAGDGQGGLLVAGGLGVAAVAGGGIWAASRRNTKKTKHPRSPPRASWARETPIPYRACPRQRSKSSPVTPLSTPTSPSARARLSLIHI